MKTIELSARMQALVNMVSEGSVVCDVGCDHGWVSIYLIQKGIAQRVYAMDVRTGPLERAKEHIARYQLEEFIETRLSDGLTNLQAGEADCMICAGMGGPLMMKILTESKEKARGMKELILQPQSELVLFRRFLRKEGYKIVAEDMVLEDGKFYPMMKVKPIERLERLKEDTDEQKLWDTYGEYLLKEKHPVLKQYLLKAKEQAQSLLQHLNEKGTASERKVQLQEELELLEKAMGYM
ncbi:MAG: SAM-dependent methyltransferase [Lachnospiraceae bacterium]|nr:SAM-dependent methyltransferase [Lachnospiraceae bacterium]